MENNPALLKSSVFGGFKKKDVLSYIFELNEATQDEKQKLAEQIEELLQSRESLSSHAAGLERELEELKAKLSETAARLDEERIRYGESIEIIETLRSEIIKHENTISQQNAEITRQTDLISKLAEKNRGFEEKRHQVELAASQIAELLGQAKGDAGNIVERAKLEAEEIVSSAKASIEAHVEEANKSVDAAYEKFGGFKSEIEKLHIAVLKATGALTDEMQALEDKVLEVGKLAPEKLSAESLPVLRYENESETGDGNRTAPPAVTDSAIDPDLEAEASDLTKNILLRYGVRKDDSGFFRLASDT